MDFQVHQNRFTPAVLRGPGQVVDIKKQVQLIIERLSEGVHVNGFDYCENTFVG